METKKLSKFSILFIVLLFSCSCNDSKSNEEQKRKKHISKSDTLDTDNRVVFTEVILVNNLKYKKQTITDYSVNHNLIHFLYETDTIEFEKSELFVKDSIYDINSDGKNDFIIKYQSTDGFVTYTYLFNKISNRLATSPDTLYNFTPVDKKSFFQIYDEFMFLRFEKYYWSNTKTVEKTYLVDYSNELLHYYKVVNNDTIKIKASEIPKKEMTIMKK